MIVGDRVVFHSHFATSTFVVERGAELVIGDNAFINYGADICARKQISIGESCRIGTHCIIMDSDFHHVELERRDEEPPAAEVVLEPHVWVGNRVTILKGVRIGYGSVVAAGSVVTKSLPPMTVSGGVPARVIRTIESPTTPDNLVTLQSAAFSDQNPQRARQALASVAG
jgi:maltose O-acetyltransferase